MSLFNLSPALNSLSTALVIVRRPSAAGFGNDGTAATPSFTTFTNVRTSFQNIRGEDLKHLPEGEHNSTWQKIWPQMQLLPADRIVHPTKGTYVVQTIGDSRDDGGFTSAFVRKLGDGES